MTGFIACEFKRTIFSEHRDDRLFEAGMTVAEIVDMFDKPAEFSAFGAVILYDPDRHGLDEHGLPNGQWIEREYWHRIRPKAGMAIFVSVVPHGGGGGSSGKSIFALVAVIALIALTAWVGGGGLAFLAPGLLGAGTIGAHVAAAAIGIAGATAISLLTKPAAGQISQASAAAGMTLGSAGITQNKISPYQQLPAVLGTFRTSPSFLASPFTTIENGEQVVHAIVGLPGKYDISDIRIDTTPVADLPTGVLEYETRAGDASDADLTLITESGFEQTPGSELSKHRLDTDSQTLLQPVTSSYPKEQIVRTARRCNRFRITLQFPSGVAYALNSNKILLSFRLRLRRVGSSTWINLPEVQFEASIRSGLRQEIWLWFGRDEGEVLAEATGQTFWPRFYLRNSEWTANSYFNSGDAATPSANSAHCYAGANGIYFFLDESTFAVDQYDIGITRGFADTAGSNFTATSYIGGLFTYRTFSDPNYKIPDQSLTVAATILENYTSFRDEYPIARRGMAMIAVKAHNLAINSISAIFSSYAGTGAATDNPADLLSFVLTGNLNGRPLDPARLESLSTWKSHCTSVSLACNALITQGSVEQAAAMVAIAGEALLRRSDKWGVVIDQDRSAESVVASFSPSNMTSPLTITKNFLAGAAQGVLPSFHDETQDYAVTDLPLAIFDDGVEQSDLNLVEGASYDGLTTAAQVTRRAKRDLRAMRMRSIKYQFGTHLNQLNIKKGSLVGLSHDVLIDTYAAGRVKAFTVDSGNLIDVTLNTDLLDLPPASFGANFFVWPMNWFRGSNMFTGDGPELSVQIENADGTILTVPIGSVDGRTLAIAGTVAAPAALKKSCMASVGPVDRVTRRVILADITPADDFHATVTCVDEAPAIYQNLPAAA